MSSVYIQNRFQKLNKKLFGSCFYMYYYINFKQISIVNFLNMVTGSGLTLTYEQVK